MVFVTVATALLAVGCGTVGSLASPTPVPTDNSRLPPTPSFTDTAKSEITTLFGGQAASITGGNWEAVYRTCNPSYRARRDLERFTGDVGRYLSRLETTAPSLDVRNPVVTRGRDDRFDLNYDLYIDDEFSQTIRVGGAYVYINGQWYDDGVWCR